MLETAYYITLWRMYSRYLNFNTFSHLRQCEQHDCSWKLNCTSMSLDLIILQQVWRSEPADYTSLRYLSRAGVSKLFKARATLGNSALSTGRIKWEMNNSMYMSFIESTTFHKLKTKHVRINYRILMKTDSQSKTGHKSSLMQKW
jgi:hypothetical protein